MTRIVSETDSPFAAEEESALAKPSTLPPRFSIAASKESLVEPNYSTNMKCTKPRISSKSFPLLKFNENLYNFCQLNFSKYLSNKRNDIKLIINNKINQHISFNDYISNISNNVNSEQLKLTPIPFINKRKIKNAIEKKDLKNFQRNVVLMRRLEYESKMKEKKLKKKYNNEISKIIKVQKIVRGYFVRKVIHQVNIIKETLITFFNSINFCIKKKYYNILKNEILKKKKNNLCDNINDNNKKISSKNEINNGSSEIKKERSIKIVNEMYSNNSKIKENIEDKIIEGLNPPRNNNENKKKNNNNNQSMSMEKGKGKEKHDSIIDYDEYIDFSNKDLKKNKQIYKIINEIDEINENKIKDNDNNKNNYLNKNPKNNTKNLHLTDISSIFEIKKTKTEIIQRQFRKYLNKKGYYGKFDKKKIALVYLIKNMILYNIKPYVLNILKLNYKKLKSAITTQEINFFNITSERIKNVSKIYRAAKNEIKI